MTPSFGSVSGNYYSRYTTRYDRTTPGSPPTEKGGLEKKLPDAPSKATGNATKYEQGVKGHSHANHSGHWHGFRSAAQHMSRHTPNRSK